MVIDASNGLAFVWAVDYGAYENNGIRWIFVHEADARAYAEKMNAIEDEKAKEHGGHRSMDSHYDVSYYKIAVSLDTAIVEDQRRAALYISDKEAWWKEP